MGGCSQVRGWAGVLKVRGWVGGCSQIGVPGWIAWGQALVRSSLRPGRRPPRRVRAPARRRRRQVLPHVVGPDRQLAVPAIDHHRQLDPRGPPVVEHRIDRRPYRPARVEHVVHDHDRAVVDRELEVGGVDDRRTRPYREVIAIERDVQTRRAAPPA